MSEKEDSISQIGVSIPMDQFYLQLIDVVKKYREIYDLSDKDYSNRSKRRRTWEIIGMALNTSGQDCKKYWGFLRYSFNTWLQKKKDPDDPNKKWRYEKELAFLLPFMRNIPAIYHKQNINSEDETAHSPAESEPSIPDLRPEKRKKPSPTVELIRYIVESQKGEPPDDIERFFTGIASTVRSFPKKDIAVAKARIFEVVSKMEIDILNRPPNVEDNGLLEVASWSNEEVIDPLIKTEPI